MEEWSIAASRKTYNIAHWSGGYFDINEAGHMTACPGGESNQTKIDLYQLSMEIRDSGLSFPVLVRFSDILKHRVDGLVSAFLKAIGTKALENKNKTSCYTAVYPIKVNQQHSVIEQIVSHGGNRVGLEAGSKPELMAVLAQAPQDGGTIICNGYKDMEYIRLALIGRALGHRLFIVIEKLSELELVFKAARDMGITPLLGLRVRLASIGSGNWQNTGGDKSKFGLSANQVIVAIERLKKQKMVESAQMLHFHMGSQIPLLADIRKGLAEGAGFYAALVAEGLPIGSVNVGGGLGIDYEGTRSQNFCSVTYSIDDYAGAVVEALNRVCVSNDIEFPEIITEAGRAMVAHHAMLITNVVESEQRNDTAEVKPDTDAPKEVKALWENFQQLEQSQVLDNYYESRNHYGEVQAKFSRGELTLAQRANAENIYQSLCQRVRALLSSDKQDHRELIDELNARLASRYFVNFSLFQSMPDAWAIQQVFPVMPLYRLDEKPDQRGILEDITCDSDGRLDFYPDAEGVESTLPLHSLRPGKPYILGIFLLGAYQEILGDMHNLFGDTDSVHVALCDDGYRLTNATHGDDVDAVLRYVHFDPDNLLMIYKDKVARSALADPDRAQYLHELAEGLKGYTYLED
ncbi:MAG: biosynthetic arginine decarboxylase [Acidiferrobacterales bacterium]